jgi:hypothetical protein
MDLTAATYINPSYTYIYDLYGHPPRQRRRYESTHGEKERIVLSLQEGPPLLEDNTSEHSNTNNATNTNRLIDYCDEGRKEGRKEGNSTTPRLVGGCLAINVIPAAHSIHTHDAASGILY